MRVATAIEDRLSRAFAPASLEVIDESAKHAGHAGARPEGESHFCVVVAAEVFRGLSPLQRQRQVYQALGDLMGNEIHALRIVARVPDADPGS
jgi:BolA protein